MNNKGMEFSNMFVMFLIIGLFAFLIISASINLSNENNTETNLNKNPILNKMFGNISKELNESQASSEATRTALIEEEKNPVITTLGFVFKSILAAGNTFMSIGINMVSYIFIFVQETLSIPPVVTGTLMAILIGLMVLGIWSLVRAGR